ncbi:MAG: carbohydrate binding family 9 domain-containing protein [Chitinivibrionia bacterium]|nr:carbohydrate binding family 9 domain-containing protein [Chitinivibrionia bacterium]
MHMQKRYRHPISTFLCLVVLGISWCAGSAAGQAASVFTPNHRPELRVNPIEGSISIDGHLDDSGWKNAARAGDFTEISPGDQARPQADTEVFITYDCSRLYIAFAAHDDPSTIRATLRARDEIFNDDYVGIILDTYDNTAWAYELFVNPLGIQGDKRWTLSEEEGGSDVEFGSGGQVIKKGYEDPGFDVVFDSRGRITPDGYQVEIAIPFKSLRFPDTDEQRWRVTFWRNHPRDSRRSYSWATVLRDEPCFLCQLGTLSGISGVRPGSSFEFLPTIVGSQSGELRDGGDPDSGFDNRDPDIDPSLGIRYGISSSVGAELALNPDFSQVESDVAQIDVNTTFALFFPERRPFFQEGSDLFRSWWNAVYTRTINDPSVTAKITGRTSTMGFVALAARDEHTPLIIPLEERSLVVEAGKSTCGISRFRRSLKDGSYAGALATSRWYDGGGSGTLLGLDGLVRFKQNYALKAQGLASITREPDEPALTEGAGEAMFARGAHTVALDGESYEGIGAYIGLERDARHWQSTLDYWDSSPTFRADNGFVFRNSERRVEWNNSYAFYPDNRWLDEIIPSNEYARQWNAFGLYKAQSVENWIEAVFKRQTSVMLGYDFYAERFRDVCFDDMRLFYSEIRTAFSDALQCGFWLGLGDRIARSASPPALGEGAHIDAWAVIKPAQRLVIEPIFMYSELSRKDTGEEVFNGYILRTRVNYQFNRELFLRFVVQYDDFSGDLAFEPLLTYQINPFSVFYIGGGTNYFDFARLGPEPENPHRGFDPTEWHVFFKLQYLFRL